MKERRWISHLRLLDGKGSAAQPNSPVELDPRQMSLPYADRLAFHLVLVDALDRDAFREIMEVLLPSWIVDVRAVPRFDVIESSRQALFAFIGERKIRYVDLFGMLGIRSYRSEEADPAIWSAKLAELLASADERGPYLLLFDNRRLLLSTNQVLPKHLIEGIGEPNFSLVLGATDLHGQRHSLDGR
ncbi:MAG: hypothetical protein OXM56_08845 [Gammaproteobacteria bacterium]|nr:hypothetical protein [Gammaproteobacteria bacterium]